MRLGKAKRSAFANVSSENKVALLVGAALARVWRPPAFAGAGAAVALAAVNGAGARFAAEGLVAFGHKAIGIRCDVADPDKVAAMVAQAAASFGRRDPRSAMPAYGVFCRSCRRQRQGLRRVNAVNLRGVCTLWSGAGADTGSQTNGARSAAVP